MVTARLTCFVAVAFLLTGLLGVGHSSQPYWIAMSFGYYATSPYPSGNITLSLGIQNVGTAQQKIIGMNVSVGFIGQLPAPVPLPLILQPGERKDFQIPVQVPRSTSPGSYMAIASIAYEYLDPITQQWILSPDSPWSNDYPVGILPIPKTPSMIYTDAFTALAGISIVSGTIPVVTAVLDRKRKTSFVFVGRGLGLVGGTFGLLELPLTLFGSGQLPLSQEIFSTSVFVCSIFGIFGLSPIPRAWIRGLAMLGGALTVLLSWWYYSSLYASTYGDSGAQSLLSFATYYFWWISLIIVGGLMMIIGRSDNVDRVRVEPTMQSRTLDTPSGIPSDPTGVK